MKLRELVSMIIVIILILSMIPLLGKLMDVSSLNSNCSITGCINTTLNQFNKCIDLGIENTGFLSSEHYYLCDGIKVTNSCTKYGRINVTNGSIFEYVGRDFKCEETTQ